MHKIPEPINDRLRNFFALFPDFSGRAYNGLTLAARSSMKRSNDYLTVMLKIQETQRNCGVKLRSKRESLQIIKQRLDQLRLNQKTESTEYRLLLAIHLRNA